jgi:hypothetical protein
MRRGYIGPTTAILAAATWCMGWFCPVDVKAQSPVLECSIGTQEKPEVLVINVASGSINTGDRLVEGLVTVQSITWKEGNTVRAIDRSTGAVLHRLPDKSYFQIGQCRSSSGKF